MHCFKNEAERKEKERCVKA